MLKQAGYSFEEWRTDWQGNGRLGERKLWRENGRLTTDEADVLRE